MEVEVVSFILIDQNEDCQLVILMIYNVKFDSVCSTGIFVLMT